PPPASSYYGTFVEIYHYNTDSHFIELIFSEIISKKWDEDDLDTTWHLNYIFNYVDILHNNSVCLNEIIIKEGFAPKNKDVFNFTAKRHKEHAKATRFVYTLEAQTYFEHEQSE